MPTIQRGIPARPGRALSNRYRLRKFKHADDMHRFLAEGDNALHWKLSTHDLPSGIYAAASGRDRVSGKHTITFHKLS